MLSKKYERLLQILGEVSDLNHSVDILHWDEQCNMPVGGSQARREQKATLQRLSHDRSTSPETGELLAELSEWAAAKGYESVEASVVRFAQHEFNHLSRVPTQLISDMSLAKSRGNEAWRRARAENRFDLFKNELQELIDLNIAIADAVGYEEHRYDALLDRREAGLRTSMLKPLFQRLRDGQVPLVKRIVANRDDKQRNLTKQYFESDRQWDFSIEACKVIGFDFDRGRQDLAVHPFAISFSPNDVRLTTRINENHFNACFFGSLHEAGHGIYMQGTPHEFRRNLLDRGALGLHESQSRLWENVVGRSRGFWEHMFPRLRDYFPTQVQNASVDDWHRSINVVEPSCIRVEADEVTYNLHIILRFELELLLLEGSLSVSDLPEAWNERMREYLGITPPDMASGVLQDVHWSWGMFGSFPNYALGNVRCLQIYERARSELGDLDGAFARGEFTLLLDWLKENMYVYGKMFTPLEYMERLTGVALDPEPYLNYLDTKYKSLYDL